MECREALERIHDVVDGRLAPGEAAAAEEHFRSCPGCSAEVAAVREVGDMVRLWAALGTERKSLPIGAMWTRVRARIDEGEERRRRASRFRKLLWIPAAAALAVFAVLIYPSREKNEVFRPGTFDVAVESLESDDATVALVDKGEDFPRVIWIIEDGRT